MESMALLGAMCVCLCVLIPLFFIQTLLRYSRKQLLLPPGPRGLPIIGHLHLLGKSPHQSLYHLSKQFGPLLHLRMGSLPVVVASSPDMARQILQTHDHTFASHPPNFAFGIHVYDTSSILTAPPGPYWKLMREICVSDLFSNKRLEYFKPVRTEETRALLRSVLEKAAARSPMSIREDLHTASCNIISRITLGKRVSELSGRSHGDSTDRLHQIVPIMVEIARLLGAFNVGDYIPWLAWMDLQGYVRRCKAVAQETSIVFQEIIDARRSTERERDETLLDLLLTAALNSHDLHISDDNVRSVLVEMFAAGVDTVSSTIEWAFASVLAHPRAMKRLQEELEQVVGGSRLVDEADLPNLPYLRAAVKESMRLHPTGPLLVPHMSSQPCTISGYDIPSHTIAFVNIWAIGRDPSVWENPSEYYPERFLDSHSHVEVRGQHFELLPFSSGRRGCPAWRMGLLNVHIILANIFHAFEWTSSYPPDLTEEPGSSVLLLANPVVANTKPKLPTHVFEAMM